MGELELLGSEVSDEISGFTGIVTTVGDHLTGCTLIGVRPSNVADTSKRGLEEFFVADQLEVVDDDTEWTEYGENALTDTDVELGEAVKDVVTGTKGIVAVLNYSLFNCPSAAVQPVGQDATEKPDINWFDTPRLESTGDGVLDDFTDLQESQEVEETGAVVDAPKDRSSVTADRM